MAKNYYSNHASDLVKRYNTATPTYLAHAKTLARPGARILDVGCGTGRDVARLREAGFDARGVDQSPEMIHAGSDFYGLPEGVLTTASLPGLVSITGRP